MTPSLGNYYLTPKEVQSCLDYDSVIIVDMSLPEDNIQQLAQAAKVLIFDHHLGKVMPGVFHHNPVIQGQSPALYPSASWIINRYLDQSINLFAVLGAVGDHEQKIESNRKIFPLIEEFCQQISERILIEFGFFSF